MEDREQEGSIELAGLSFFITVLCIVAIVVAPTVKTIILLLRGDK